MKLKKSKDFESAATGVDEPLDSIPGIGPSLAADLRELGYGRVAELAGADPQEMYDRLVSQRGEPVDRCVLYAFRCAVEYAGRQDSGRHDLRWWDFSDARLGRSRVGSA